MITTAKAFVTSDNKTHATLDAAQKAELFILFADTKRTDSETASFCTAIMEHRDKVVDILTTTASSKPRARKVNGGTKKRKAAPAPVPGGPQQ